MLFFPVMGMEPENCFLKQLFIVKEQLLLSLNANFNDLLIVT